MTCVEDVLVPQGTTVKVRTGLMLAESIDPLIVGNKLVAVPFLKIEGRSGLAAKGIFPVGGIVDPRYRGEILVVLTNLGTDHQDGYQFYTGDRIAQLVCYFTLANVNPYLNVSILEATEVGKSTRGAAGFGSSGV